MENILLKEAIIMANSNNMCRLCLSANGITEPICYDQRDQFLLQKIFECTTLQITPLTGIPSSLCTICKARLDEFYQFRWQCIKNDEIIRRIADNFPKPQPTEAASQNPKQELIEPQPSGDTAAAPVDDSSEYNVTEKGHSNEREAHGRFEHNHHTQHQETVPAGRLEQLSYNIGDHNHPNQYGVGPPPASTVPTTDGFPPDTKYSVQHSVVQQFEFADFRRKRGRPPKQKYDQYHHPVVKYGENSIDGIKTQRSIDCSDSGPMIEEPETILTYGENSSRGSDYQHEQIYNGWSNQPKIKLEQVDHHSVRYDEPPPDAHEQKHEDYMKHSTINPAQPMLIPDGFVKRSRGRPPREGGCPNQDRTEYRFQCQYCDARFKAAINLKLHTNTHTGERPYKCQLCDKCFAHPSNLSVHSKLHSQERVKREGTHSEKKFQCPYCHTLFALAFQLKIHINTHTGLKPYVCKNCGKGFAQPSNLHVHVKKHCHKRMDYDAVSLSTSHQISSHPNHQTSPQTSYQPLPSHHHPLPPPPPPPSQQEHSSSHISQTAPNPNAGEPNHTHPSHHQQQQQSIGATPTVVEHPQKVHQHDVPPVSTARPLPLSIPSVMLV
ncbi:zinc finger protein 7-like [Malaya genurostris]|uniref:zinc finger protein 7-like n=1 Tax=Malaya genurostris TaxID=325434 RepID=UPI0026F3CE60|nr:zinc finger protein 7-like [Malaya genurostris]